MPQIRTPVPERTGWCPACMPTASSPDQRPDQHDQRGVADERGERQPRQRLRDRVAQAVARRARPAAGRALPSEHGEARAARRSGPPRRRTGRARRVSVLAARPVGAIQGPRASARRRSAGEPDQNSPAGTTPSTSEPGATSASVADVGAGAQGAAGADPGAGADRIAPTWTTSPSIQWPAEVDLGLDGGALADVEEAGDRRERVQVDALADARRRAGGRRRGTTVRRPAPAAASSSWIRSASQMPEVDLAAARVVARA